MYVCNLSFKTIKGYDFFYGDKINDFEYAALNWMDQRHFNEEKEEIEDNNIDNLE